MRPRISAVINTRNEERNLPFALRSVAPWVDEVVVVDMESTDGTVSIARSFGALTHSFKPCGYVEPARAFAVTQATGDWVLILDADEVIPEPLSRELLEIATQDSADVVNCHRRNFILGSPMRGTGWSIQQELHPRFFRKGRLVFHQEIHSVPTSMPNSRIVTVKADDLSPLTAIHHFNYLGYHDFIDRMNRYTSIEATEAYERGDQVSPARGVLAAIREFMWRYVRARGFRDGWRGFHLAALMAAYRFLVNAKHLQLSLVGTDQDLESKYVEEAEALVSRYAAPVLKESPS